MAWPLAEELFLRLSLYSTFCNPLASSLSEDTKKKLWLRVARHVVQEKNDIKQVTLLLVTMMYHS